MSYRSKRKMKTFVVKVEVPLYPPPTQVGEVEVSATSVEDAKERLKRGEIDRFLWLKDMKPTHGPITDWSRAKIKEVMGTDVPTDAREQIKIIRNWLKKKAPTLSVRMARGTAWGWVDIRGSGEYGNFTEKERAVLKEAGLRPGGNFAVISPEDRKYWTQKALEEMAKK